MKTKEELLKIYSAYLPYEFKCENKVYKYERFRILSPLDLLKDGYIFEPPDYIYPILYSMDMLTKEIEHKGERFIPTVWLRDNHAEFDISKNDMETLISMFLHIFRSPFSAPHYFIEKLLEWHFNVFGLDESEYIKKESLK